MTSIPDRGEFTERHLATLRHWTERADGQRQYNELRDVQAHCERLATEHASQSARIADLEAELAKAHEVTECHRDRERALETERDAARKALAFAVSRCAGNTERVSAWLYSTALAVRGLPHEFDHDGTGTSVEAALLAAAREGGG